MGTEMCQTYLDTWLHQVKSAEPDAGPVIEAARHVATCPTCGSRLRQMAQALESTVEDRLTCDACQERLADYIHAQVTGTAGAEFAVVRDHLALCPHCAGAYAQVYEWVVESLADAVPVSETYPAFDLPFEAQPSWSEDVVQRAVEQGRQWVQDAVGAVYVLFGPGLQATSRVHRGGQPAVAWATKSAEPGTLLYQAALGEEAAPGWEIEVSAFAGDEKTSQIEVAVYQPGIPDAELAGVPVALRYEEVTETAETDAGGVVEFAGLPTAKLDQVVVRIEPTRQ
ncbi:MAG: hypothetical protein ACE5F6_01020 [Anaerolineae bacterium]